MDSRKNFSVNPFTFRGVASFAHAPFWGLAAISLSLALLLSGLALHWVNRAIIPPIRQAVEGLPTQAQLKAGILTWPEAAGPLLCEGPFLSLAVNPSDSRLMGQSADFQLDFRRDRFLLRTVLGEWSYSYDDRWALSLARAEVEPWWGAWQPFIQGGVFIGTFLFLQLSWLGLSIGASFFVRGSGVMLRRNIAWLGSWQLSYAALFPGAMLMGLAIILYTTLQLSLTGLMILMPTHLIVGLLYLIGGTVVLPPRAREVSRIPNPFGSRPDPTKKLKSGRKNPFRD